MEHAVLVNLFTLVKYLESLVGLGADHIERARPLKGLRRFVKISLQARFPLGKFCRTNRLLFFFN